MLRDLTIQNYRCFQAFKIDDLARVNLIVGGNNTGKTSLLEAIYLYVTQNHPSSFVSLLENSGKFFIQEDGYSSNINKWWDAITLTPKEEKVVKAL